MVNTQVRSIDQIAVLKTIGADHYFGVTAEECYRLFGAVCDMDEVRRGERSTICRTDVTRTIAVIDSSAERFTVSVYH